MILTGAVTWVINNTVLKSAFGYSFILSGTSMIEQNLGEEGFFTEILESVPSKITVILGIVYGIVLVAKQVSDLIKKIQKDRLEVKQAKEKLNQDKIETAERQKDLDR